MRQALEIRRAAKQQMKITRAAATAIMRAIKNGMDLGTHAAGVRSRFGGADEFSWREVNAT